ncbi:transmembrane protein 231-like isoform X2 [Stegodyphus dumicola]|uniref:transmembrane protein 231-like isoform X2 n=1 Tax=Stegodyphus dumicola TaxID=202533 RepID=UPI0015AD23E2|nr:transmembrane protein 231-like isoform X2 [Stegodyphus dumicola]
MALYEVFSHSVKIKHKTTLCSKTSLFYILATALQFIFPILVAYYTQGFLKRTGTYREQPDVSFKHKMLLILETKFPEQLIFWSSYKKLNQMMSSRTLQLIPEIEHREVDANRDGKKDEIQMSIDIPLTDQEIYSVKLILIFDYKLYLYSYFQMECAAFIYCSSALPGSALSVVGDLMFIQKQPLKHTGEDERYNIPVIDDKKDDFSSTNLKNIFLEYSRRNALAFNLLGCTALIAQNELSWEISILRHW